MGFSYWGKGRRSDLFTVVADFIRQTHLQKKSEIDLSFESFYPRIY
jgi:hypothetical protein